MLQVNLTICAFNQSKKRALLKGAIRCLRSRLSIFVYIRNVLVIYVHGISYTVY